MAQSPDAPRLGGNDPPHAIEARVRAELRRGDVAAAAARAIAFYGPEVHGFLIAARADTRDASEIYARFATELRRRIAGFQWRCALRVFLYSLARAVLRHGRGAARPAVSKASGMAPLPRHPRARRLAVALMRRALPPDDRELLVLRVDRGLTWRDLALTALGEDAAEPTLIAEARRLRARFGQLRQQMKSITKRPAGTEEGE